MIILIVCSPVSALNTNKANLLVGTYNIVDNSVGNLGFRINSIKRVSKNDFSFNYDFLFEGEVSASNLEGRVFKNVMFISLPLVSDFETYIIPVKLKKGKFLDSNALATFNSSGVECDQSNLINPSSGTYIGSYLCPVFSTASHPASEVNVVTVTKLN